jgi:hypothetical protein
MKLNTERKTVEKNVSHPQEGKSMLFSRRECRIWNLP